MAKKGTLPSWKDRIRMRLTGWPEQGGVLEWWIDDQPRQPVRLPQTEFVALSLLFKKVIRSSDIWTSEVSSQELGQELYKWGAAVDPRNPENVYGVVLKLRRRLSAAPFAREPGLPRGFGKALILTPYRLDLPPSLLERKLINPAELADGDSEDLLLSGRG